MPPSYREVAKQGFDGGSKKDIKVKFYSLSLVSLDSSLNEGAVLELLHLFVHYKIIGTALFIYFYSSCVSFWLL